MRACRLFVLAMIVGVYSQAAPADEWEQATPKEYASSNGKYVLKVTPDQGEKVTIGRCHAEFLEVQADKSRKSLWTRMLINDVAPVNAFVPDSGKYAITMDDWHSVGRHPVVIYGDKGQLIKVLNVRDLGVEGDERVEQSKSSYWWNKNSIVCFGDSYDKNYCDAFFIRLHWGDTLAINLRTGDVIDDAWLLKHEFAKDFVKQLRADGEKLMRERVLALLKLPVAKGEEYDALAPIMAAGQMKLKNAVPPLRERLKSDAWVSTSVGGQPAVKVYYVRKAVKEALEALGEEVKGVVLEEKMDAP